MSLKSKIFLQYNFSIIYNIVRSDEFKQIVEKIRNIEMAISGSSLKNWSLIILRL